VPDPLSVPLLLLLFGMSLRGQRPMGREARAEVVLGTLLKSLVMPVLAWVVGRFLFDLEGIDLLGVVLMAALPTAQNVFLFAGHFRLATTTVRDVTLLSMLLALPRVAGGHAAARLRLTARTATFGGCPVPQPRATAWRRRARVAVPRSTARTRTAASCIPD
jgi:hypothetical protein